MPTPENPTYSQLKNGQDRALRSASPAVKRPASDMGAQDREEHNTDVEMGDDQEPFGQQLDQSQNDTMTDVKTRQENGKRLRSVEAPEIILPHSSDPNPVSQTAPEDATTITSAGSPALSTSKTLSSASTPLYEPTVSSDQLPSIDDQVVKVIDLMRETPQDKQKGYVVSCRWLRRVQVRSSFPPEGKPVEKSATEGPVGPIDNSDIAMTIEDSGSLKDEAGEPFTALRPGLAIGEDYEILPESAWNLIVSWYGVARTSPIITRYAHDLSEGDFSSVQYELTPPIWSFLKVPATNTPQTQREKELPPPRLLNTRATPFMLWLKQAKELVHIPMSTKVRVWRVLGGLKSASASGILTPAASRSASPAPGAEIIASAGDKMILDVNTFASLPTGEHREMIEVKDQTNDANYNGKTTLATLGLGRNDVIVLEEQASKTEDWPSETLKVSLGKSLQSRTKTLGTSRRSSPAPGIMTRGRSRKDGRPKGMTGLSNLGNTCYMNSALQSIRSVQELTEYFLHQEWKKDLNVDNPIGHDGNVAKAYADLIKMIYEDNSSSVNPSKFKSTMGRYRASFSGYGQQDSHEFLLFLLDGLHEDLNKIHKKPYIENPDSTDEMAHDEAALKAFADRNWEIYKARNDSVITDLFAGMYKSTVSCPVCDKVSIIFDPFKDLTLQLPIENSWSKEILYFPLHKRPFKIDVDIDKTSSVRALKEYCAKRTNYDADKLIMAESYSNKFFRTFNNTEILAEAQIGQADVICLYELDDIPTNYNPNKKKKMYSSYSSYNKNDDDENMSLDSPAADKLLVPVYNRMVRSTSIRSARSLFGHPSYIVINRADSASYDRILKKLLGYAMTLTTTNILDVNNVRNVNNDSNSGDGTPDDSDILDVTDDGSGSGSGNPTASSVQGEDDMVDVSMRNPSQPAPDTQMDIDTPPHMILQPGTPIPAELRNIFDIRIAPIGEAIPTRWNNIDEQKDYESLQGRAPQPLPHRPAKKANDEVESESTSADELADIDEDELKQTAGSNSESGTSVVNGSDDESDGTSLPDISEVINHQDTRGVSKHQKKKTFAARDRRRNQAKRRQPNIVTAQPQPKSQPRVSPTVAKPRALSSTALIRPGEGILLDWSETSFDSFFKGDDDDVGYRGMPTWNDIPTMPDAELTIRRAQRTNRKKNGISLEDCLNEFGKTETLTDQNPWYCPRCKENRCANKTFELWKAPDILVMHLKRFSSNRSFRDKLEVRVDYPVEGLDLSSMVRDQSDGKPLIYDLIAVDNHYGGLGGGHYTAYAKNFVNDSWYDYNDSHVSSKQDPQSVITSAAYLLFYRRRAEYPLGGPHLERVLLEHDSDGQGDSREPSPSGEGQRLGDSSHNGLSSAFPAVQIHRVGDGGPARLQNRDLTPEQDHGSPLRLNDSNDDLPTYKEATATQDDEMLLDEGIDVGSTGPLWHTDSNWNWTNIEGLNRGIAGHNSSDVDAESTKGEGPSRTSSLRDIDDTLLHSEDIDEYSRRSMRESAPAPDVPALSIERGDHRGANDLDEDDDEELPVAELKADDTMDNKMSFQRS